MKRSACSAFSLVELSIVLVILGLLVGGILAGKSLIRASELRTVSVEHDKYQTAYVAFRDKYFMLPGDITNATQFWGAAAVGFMCIATPTTNGTTCDGDGNGQIDTMSVNSFESARALQQLANAQLIERQVTYGGTVNMSRAKLTGAYWYILYGQQGGTFDGEYGHIIWLAPSTYLNSEEAWNIDSKLDDGRPATGKLVSNTTCTDTAVTSNMAANYLLSAPVTGCNLFFRRQF